MMNAIDTLIEAIKLRKPISYTYNKPDKTPGVRIGNPYAIYKAHLINGQMNVNAHIVQTGGASDSTDKQPLPSFRTYGINWLSNIEILHNQPQFTPDHKDYNPNSDMYKDVIEKVK